MHKANSAHANSFSHGLALYLVNEFYANN